MFALVAFSLAHSHTLSHTHTDSTRLFCFPFLLLVLHFSRRRLIPYAICLYATFLWPLRALYKHRVAAARKICPCSFPLPSFVWLTPSSPHLSCALRFITRLLMVFKFCPASNTCIHIKFIAADFLWGMQIPCNNVFMQWEKKNDGTGKYTRTISNSVC